jgi:6-pyruvoyltetrahydropterin/6-carboxytetrahydropterin synthase
VAQFTAVRYDTDTRLDELGRVIDFSVLKDAIGGWIDEHWDHGFIIWDEDNELGDALETIPDQKLFRLDYNPTAENMAYYLLTVVCPHVLRETGVRVVKVRLWETENCYAEAE